MLGQLQITLQEWETRLSPKPIGHIQLVIRLTAFRLQPGLEGGKGRVQTGLLRAKVHHFGHLRFGLTASPAIGHRHGCGNAVGGKEYVPRRLAKLAIEVETKTVVALNKFCHGTRLLSE